MIRGANRVAKWRIVDFPDGSKDPLPVLVRLGEAVMEPPLQCVKCLSRHLNCHPNWPEKAISIVASRQ